MTERPPIRDTLAVDTDVLVHWAMADAPHHRAARRSLEREIDRGGRLGLTLQVMAEFLHVVTDLRRFERPMPMADALRLSRELWNADEVERILPSTGVYDRACELMERYDFGRKRILDTSLAATLEAAGVARLATFNGGDFALLPFLVAVDPRGPATSSKRRGPG